MTKQQRYQWVDIAKGIGIIFVVYGHVIRGLNNAHLIDEHLFYLSDTLVYSFHMPLFFVLSGLFFKRSIEKYSRTGLIVEKCKSILYPYIIWSLLQTSIEIVLSQYTNKTVALDDLLHCIFFPRDQFWFLFTLFFINIISSLLFNRFKRWLIVSSLIWLLYYLFPVNLSVFSETFKYLIFFNIGVWISDYFLKGDFLNSISKWKYIFIFLLLLIPVEYLHVNQLNGFPLISLITAFVAVLLVVLISYKFITHSFISKISIIGTYSFEIFILHILCASGTRIVLNNFMGIQNTLTHIVAGTLCGVLIPFTIVLILGKQKWFKFLFRLP
jgi:fucose 4-O-acetylase-like acetyltransferase